jgi:hypothetical protein
MPESSASLPGLDFYRALWGSIACSGKFIEIAAHTGDGSHNKLFIPVEVFEVGLEGLKTFASQTYEVTFAPCLRDNDDETKPVQITVASACWAYVPYRDKPIQDTVDRIKAFQYPPSYGTATKDGLYLFWLLNAPAYESDLKLLADANKALAKALLGDEAAARLDWHVPLITVGDRCRVASSKRLGVRYSLQDLLGVPEGKPSDADTREIPDKLKKDLLPLMMELWVEGYRPQICSLFAGLFAHGGFRCVDTKQLVRGVASCKFDPVEPRMYDGMVEDVFARHQKDSTVAGAPTLERLINEQFPAHMAGRAREVLRLIRTTMPKKKGRPKKEGEEEANFEIVSMEKFDSRPASYHLKIKIAADEFDVKVPTEHLFIFRRFRVYAFEQSHNRILKTSQEHWEEMLGEAETTVREAPKEARPEGELELALGEFKQTEQEKPDSGMLRTIPGFDEVETYFRLDAFKAFLKERGHIVPPYRLCDFLRRSEWGSKTKRFGDKVIRVWTHSRNGLKEDEGLFKNLPDPTPKKQEAQPS